MRALLNWRLALLLAVLAAATFFAYAYTESSHAIWIGVLFTGLLAGWILVKEYMPSLSFRERVNLVGIFGLLTIYLYLDEIGCSLLAYILLLSALLALGLWGLSGIGKAIWRPDALSLLGRELGLTFQRMDTSNLARRYGVFFHVLSHGEEPQILNVLHGPVRGHEVYAFDCGGISAALVPLDCGFKPLSIQPESIGKGATDPMDKIAFESHEFTNKFRVTAEDRQYAYKVVTPQAMELLLAHPRFSVEFAGNLVLVYSGDLWTADQFREALELIGKLVDIVPPFVQKEFGPERELKVEAPPPAARGGGQIMEGPA